MLELFGSHPDKKKIPISSDPLKLSGLRVNTGIKKKHKG